jgi:hypothetical protein
VAARWSRWAPAVYILILLWVNVYIARALFFTEFTQKMGSNEGTYMAIARGWLGHPGDMLWWPYWDGGMPVQNTYLPMPGFAAAVLAKAFSLSPARALHALGGLGYCLGPVTLFWFVWRISGSAGASFTAALAYSLISPSLLFSAIRNDAGGALEPRRLQVLVHYGEVPHIVSLAILPVAVLLLYRAVTGKGSRIAAGVAAAAVVLTNAFGAVTMGLAIICLLLAIDGPGVWRRWATATGIGVFAYLWISPAVPPWMLAVIRRNSPTVDGDFRPTTASEICTVVAAVILLAAAAALRRTKWPVVLRMSTLLTIALGAVVYLGVVYRIPLMPQPHRYHIGLEMAVILTAVFWLREAMPEKALRFAVCALALAAAFQIVHYRRYAKELIQPIDITQRIEYKTAMWMREHFPKERVMVAGSSYLWFNVFTDTPQMSGGHNPSTPNPIQSMGIYVLYTGQNAGNADGEISVKWLKLFGAQAITVPGPASQEIYHSIANPRKFEGLLPVLWHEGDDTIYGVPQRTSSLVHVIPAAAVVRRPPIHGLDTAAFEPYLAAMEDPALPLPKVVWTTRHSAVIRAALRQGQVIAVQMNHHSGWRARVNGEDRPVYADAAGLTIVEPQCTGECEIALEFTGGLQFRLALVASALVTLGALTTLIRSRFV